MNMTAKQYKMLLKEFGLVFNSYYDDKYDLQEYGPDAYLDDKFDKSVCGWRRSPSHLSGDINWRAHSLIMYTNGSWNGKSAVTLKEGRKLLNEYFRNKKLKQVAKKKAEIILASKVFHI